MIKNLLISADVDPSLAERARSDGRFSIVEQPLTSEAELAAAVASVHVLVTRAHNRVTRQVIEAAPHLELIAQATSGTDNIDCDAARDRGITVISMPGVNANAVAELVIGYMLSMTRTIPFYTRAVATGDWPRNDCATRHEMAHHRLGIIGLGEVGTRVARLAAAFGVSVDACDPYITAADFERRGARRAASLASILASADVITLHVPLTAETRRMIGRAELAMMRRGSYLINAARGEVLDQQAALDALASGHLAGLALDVFDTEPPVSPLPDDPRLILTPHVAGCTHEVKSGVGARLFDKIVEFYRESRNATPPSAPPETPR